MSMQLFLEKLFPRTLRLCLAKKIGDGKGMDVEMVDNPMVRMVALSNFSISLSLTKSLIPKYNLKK